MNDDEFFFLVPFDNQLSLSLLLFVGKLKLQIVGMVDPLSVKLGVEVVPQMIFFLVDFFQHVGEGEFEKGSDEYPLEYVSLLSLGIVFQLQFIILIVCINLLSQFLSDVNP
ncbi:MAG: hypothetical protein ACYCVV_20775 [Acidimicrobiales bacterium]